MKWTPEESPRRKPKKYREGPSFQSFEELIGWLDGGGWVYGWNHKRPIHPSIILSQQCQTLLRGYARFNKAYETKEWQAWADLVDYQHETRGYL
ncbi:MAG: hypothetical protein ACR2P3_14890 [Geminicoccaceae bacterium]